MNKTHSFGDGQRGLDTAPQVTLLLCLLWGLKKITCSFMTVFTMTLWQLSYCYEYLRIGNTDVRSAVLASAECINIFLNIT